MLAVLTASKLAGLLIVGSLLLPGTSWAQGASTDPDATSPAGSVYRLPLDSARNDAAPKRRAPTGSGPSQGTGSAGRDRDRDASRPSSAIRSENGFGSSTSVPGTSGGDARDDGGGSQGAGGSGTSSGSGGSGSGGSGGGSGAGSGSAGEGTAAANDPAQTVSTRAEVDSGPSSVLTYGLLALVLAAGVAGGLVTRMRRRAPG